MDSQNVECYLVDPNDLVQWETLNQGIQKFTENTCIILGLSCKTLNQNIQIEPRRKLMHHVGRQLKDLESTHTKLCGKLMHQFGVQTKDLEVRHPKLQRKLTPCANLAFWGSAQRPWIKTPKLQRKLLHHFGVSWKTFNRNIQNLKEHSCTNLGVSRKTLKQDIQNFKGKWPHAPFWESAQRPSRHPKLQRKLMQHFVGQLKDLQ